MENNENFVNQTENVEQTTEQIAEQPEKVYTQDDVERLVNEGVKKKLDEVMPGKIARREARIRKEYDQKYGDLERVLKAGTGTEDLKQITDSLRGYYQQQGVPMQEKPAFSEEDIRTLANADADEIIDAGFDEVVDEVNRLASIGAEKMTPRERVMFERLANYRHGAEREKALAEIGVPESVYNSQEFKTFAGQFHRNVPITDVYKLYEKTVKTSSVEPMGSMKNGNHGEEKTYYSPEDVDKLRPEDLDNPVIFQRVRESMKRW